VFGENSKDWEKCVFIFVKKQQLQAIIPHIPTKNPQLDRLVYEIILVHFLNHDRDALLTTIKKWPPDIYDVSAVVVAIKAQLDRSPNTPILMECLAELYMLNRQPGKALEYFLRLRRPNVFDLIRDHNLFTVVKDQALLLVEFDQELEKKRKSEVGGETAERSGADEKGKGKKETSKAIALLVDHTYSIPIARVVQQLQVRPYYLYLYLDALFDKDPQLAADFADIQLQLYAEYAPPRLIDFLRASNNYSLEKAYQICKARDLVLEMVFLLGRMGDNKKALTLIIERLGDVNRAIDFAKEQNDDDLWEDLLRYSETRPPFIRGLLENVGAEIDPIRLIRRIKNGLEIPGLKDALIKILWDFNLQISLLEGCQTILHSDCTTLATGLQARQTNGTRTNAAVPCPICSQPLFSAGALPLPASTNQQPLALMFLCRHIVHVTCVKGGNTLPRRPIDDALVGFLGGIGNGRLDNSAILSGKIAYSAVVRSRLEESCPVCHLSEDGPGAHRR
ncbi:Vacuolar protein sorting-associated protein 41, partial [Tulasnella sp. 418]